MGQARELRDNATRCLRLSKLVECPDDIAWLQSVAAEATQAAERIEADEKTAVLAQQHPSDQFLEKSSNAGALDVSDAGIDRDPTQRPNTSPDRRRAGRREVSSVLIPLLRERPITEPSVDPADDGSDQLSASRGIVVWTLISAAVWVPLLWWML